MTGLLVEVGISLTFFAQAGLELQSSS
jgi:hypothetical protein